MIKTAFIGVGYRGMQLLRLLRHIPGFRILACADPGIEDVGMPDVACYNRGEHDYLNMLEEQTPDLVFVASPWQCHVQHAIHCVEHGADVALEIKGGLYLDEYKPLIDLAERTGKRVYPLENTLFMRENLAVYNLVRAGVLGEIVYMRGGYRHDLRRLLLDDDGVTTYVVCYWTMTGRWATAVRRKASGGAGSTRKRTATFIPRTAWLLFA